MRSKDVHLEPVGATHAALLFNLVDSNRDHLRQWLPWVDGVSSNEDIIDFICRSREQSESGRDTNYVIYHCEKAAGVIGFHPVDWVNRSGELGYWLSREFTGRGVATQAAELLLERGFTELGLNRIEIRCASGNTRSIAVAKRLGMVYEGTLREEERLYDRFVDHAVFSILSREYISKDIKRHPGQVRR